jgi:hypothetical protein
MSNANSAVAENQVEPWCRLWLPTETWDQFRGIDGDFLADHGGLGGIDHALEDSLPGINHLSAHAAVPFLTLLGRPGSGKSRELRMAADNSWLGDRPVLIEGKEFGSTNAAVFLETAMATHLAQPARLIIDGLDEVLLANPQFVAQLKGWFRRNLDEHGRARHSLAISCRWADWQEAQISDLAALWPAEQVKSLVLAPLRRADAVETLIRRLGEARAEEFWKQLRELRLIPVACWPQGFLALLRQFESSGCTHIAESHADVIRDQILSLCRLSDSPDDALRWEHSAPGTEWRRRIAGRIAATMIVSGRAQLKLRETDASAETDALSVREIGATDELWEGQRRLPKLEDLDAVVHRTGLMRRLAGTELWVFESQVYQEWLAADWLVTRNLDVRRLKQIFGSEVEGHWMVAPRMRATAAWLARYHRDFCKLILDHDPLALLAMDGACLPDQDRKDIVEAVLNATESVRVLDPAIRHSHLPSLRHHELAPQLERWLTRSDVTDATRQLAIELAEKTNTLEISPTLWRIYPDASKRLKPEIAGALLRLAKEGFDDQWRAVLKGEISVDAHGNLLGAALHVMVIESGKIPIRDVIRDILPERRFEVFGLYQTVASQIHERLTIGDLPVVFAKLAENPYTLHDSISRAKDFNDTAVKLAAREIGRSDTKKALVDYWHACLDHHIIPNRDVVEIWQDRDDLRRDFIHSLVLHPDFERHRKHGWVSTDDYLLEDRDFEWCLDRIETVAPDDQWRFAMLASAMIWRVDLSGHHGQRLDEIWSDRASLRGMLPTPQTGETVSQAIIRIASEKRAEREAKANHHSKRQEQREQAHRERMAQEAARCRIGHEQGKLVWPGAFRILLFRNSMATSGIVSFVPISEIGPEDAWMREAAARYITDAPANADFGSDYGLHGLLALAACSDRLNDNELIRRGIETHWLVHLIPLLCNHGLGDPPEGISNKRFAEDSPEAFTRAFGMFIRNSYRKDGSLSELHQLAEFKLPSLLSELKAVLLEESIRPAGFFTGMWFLSRAGEEAAIEVALHWLPELAGELPHDAAASLFGASAILVNGRLSAEIEEHFANKALVYDAIRTAASRLDWYEREMDFSGWSDYALKMLGDAIWRAYPVPDRHNGSRGTFEFHGVTDVDHAMEFRDRLSSAAWSRGIDLEIPEAIEGESDEEAAQRRHMIDWHLHTNRQTRAGSARTTILPEVFLKLADRPQARLAKDSEELLDAVIESLERWEHALEAQSIWDNLWNDQKIKEETRIAREMRDWLRRDLDVIVECEIKLASEGRSDIVIQTLTTDRSPGLTVVIELKKHLPSNAKDRRTAMKSQLVDRYLRERQYEGWTHGLYVVAWTPKPGSRADSMDAIERARQEFAQQAEALSVAPFTVKSMVIDARYRG